MQQIYLILDNIRSMENVGSIFRTADAAGVKKIYLCGITPKPPRKEIDKAALGAVDFVDWEYAGSTKSVVESLKNKGVEIIALEQDARSVDYTNNQIQNTNNQIAIIVGNEVDGVSKEVLDRCDLIVEIPMHGQKKSLNVSVATGVILFELIK